MTNQNPLLEQILSAVTEFYKNPSTAQQTADDARQAFIMSMPPSTWTESDKDAIRKGIKDYAEREQLA